MGMGMGWGWGVGGIKKIQKMGGWGLGVGEICPKYAKNGSYTSDLRVAIGMDGSFVDDKHDDLP